MIEIVARVIKISYNLVIEKTLTVNYYQKGYNHKRTINIHEENLKARTENCTPILNEIEQASQELYDFLSSSRSIFVV